MENEMEESLYRYLEKQKETKNIKINMDLKTLVNVATQTELVLGGKYNLPSKEDISYIQSLYIEINLLEKVLSMMMPTYKISTPNSDSFLSKSETSYQYIKTLKNKLESEYNNKVKRIKRSLDGKALMPQQLFSYEYGKNMNSWAKGVRIKLFGTTSDIFNRLTKEEQIKNVIEHIRYLSIVMQTSYSKKNLDTYEVSFSPKVIERYEYVYSENPKKETKEDIVEAALTYARMKFENKKAFKEFISKETITDSYMENKTPTKKTLSEIYSAIDKKYQTIHSEEIAILKKMYQHKFQFLESKLILTKIKDYLENNSILDCKLIFSSIIIKISKELSEIDSKLKETTIKIENIENSLESKLTENKNSNQSEREDSISIDIGASPDNKNQDEFENQSQRNHSKEVLNKEEKEKYEYYVAIREKVDKIVERKNTYASEEMFKMDIVYELSYYGLGNTYEEVIKNFQNMRKELEATKILEKLMNDIADDLDLYPGTKEQTENNGLTVYENRVAAKMLALLNDETISDELRNEIEYYLKKYKELVSDIKFVLPVQNEYNSDAWEQMLNDNKKRKYFNTIFIETLNLNDKTDNNSIKK